MLKTIPLFPLQTLLYPGGYLPLKVFEPRYLDMVTTCIHEQQSFGVCLIQSGHEVNDCPRVFSTGTLAHVVSWEQDARGMLEVIVLGGEKYELKTHWAEADGLMMGEVHVLPQEPILPVLEKYQAMADFLDTLVNRAHLNLRIAPPVINYENAVDVSFRLAEVLPLPSITQQKLLEMVHPYDRLEKLQLLLQDMDFTWQA